MEQCPPMPSSTSWNCQLKALHDPRYGVADQDDGCGLDDVGLSRAPSMDIRWLSSDCRHLVLSGKLDDEEGLAVLLAGDSALPAARPRKDQQRCLPGTSVGPTQVASAEERARQTGLLPGACRSAAGDPGGVSMAVARLRSLVCGWCGRP